jgi:two-component system CheB/CheR fusion protein
VAVRQPASADPRAVARLVDLVRRELGLDLRLYKDRYVWPRVTRRMRASGESSLPDYVDRLQADPWERRRLLDSLTIKVTSFFRNPETFHALSSRVLPAVVADKAQTGSRAIRLWSAGCATGEEAYSIAICLLEALAATRPPVRPMIFATDIDRGALAVAKAGRYAAGALRAVPPSLRERYFAREGAAFRAGPALRRLIFFKVHNLLEPPPFSRIDVVVLRNVLIYMQPPLQRRVLQLLHRALNPGGFLILGKVETIGREMDRLFEPVQLVERIFRRPARAGEDHGWAG